VPLQDLLKLFVVPTLQFFKFIEFKFMSNLNIRKNCDFWIRILKDSNPQDSIFHYMHPYSLLLSTKSKRDVVCTVRHVCGSIKRMKTQWLFDFRVSKCRFHWEMASFNLCYKVRIVT